VLELELAQRSQSHALLLGELLARIRGKRQEAAGAPAGQRPQGECDRGNPQRQDDDEYGHQPPVSISRLIRSRIAGSTTGRAAGARAARRGRWRTGSPPATSPTRTATNGTTENRSGKPRPRGDTRSNR